MSNNIAFEKKGQKYFSMESRSYFGIILAIAILFVIFIWAAFAKISGAVIAIGRIELQSNIRKIQHREGGIIREIFVNEGQNVQEGQTLVRLDTTVSDANQNSVNDQIWQLRALRNRLLAERNHTNYDSNWNGGNVPIQFQSYFKAEYELMKSRQTLKSQQKSQLREQIAQSQHEIVGMQKQISALENQSALISKELVGVKEVYEQGYASFTRLSQVQRESEGVRAQIASLTSSIAQSRARISQIQEAMLQIDSQSLTEVMNDLKETEAKLEQLKEQEIVYSDAGQRTEIKAPSTGKVQQLLVHTIGGVIAPGETLMYIIPQNDDLIVDAKIDPQKIDEVKIGSDAFVRFTAFNMHTTPELKGKVDNLTSNVETDEKTGISFYRARLRLDAMKIPKEMRDKMVAGQPVEVQISTNERSVLSYFIKPITDQFARTFKEE